MTWVATAVIGGAAIGAIGSNMAAGKQAGAQEQAAQTQAQMFNTITQQEQPFIQGGYGAESTLNQLLGTSAATGAGGTAAGTDLPGGYLTQTFNPTLSQLVNYPGFQFSLDMGNAATQNASAPGLGALSGPAQEGLSQFNQGLAQSYYGNYFNQFQTQQNNIFDRLSQIASLGQNAAGNLGNAGTQLGAGIAQAQAAAGGSIAAGIVGATNSLSGSAVPLAYLLGNQSVANAGSSYASGAAANSAVAGAGLYG
jgi:hypothetical protein